VSSDEWAFSDAWLMMAVAGFQERGCSLVELVPNADMLNHAIPTLTEVRQAVGRLVASGLMREADRHLTLTDEGLRLAGKARGGLFTRVEDLRRRLQHLPLQQEQWDLPADAWRNAVNRYLEAAAKRR
jgi:hypothetical protein